MSFGISVNSRPTGRSGRRVAHRDAKAHWTMHEIWTGPKGMAEIESNNRGGYRVTFGETVKHFPYSGMAADGRGNAFHSATTLAKTLSGRVEVFP